MKYILIHTAPAVTSAFLFQLLFHEAGHFLGGVLTGWRLLYIQLFNTAVIKQKNGYRIKITNTFGFQCIMYPKKEDSKAQLYTLGGCIANFIITLLSLVMMIAFWRNQILIIYAWSFFVSGSVLFLVNGIPRVKRICNDGACYKLLKNDPVTRQIHNNQLLTAERLHAGCSYKNINFNLITSQDYAYNDILAYQSVLEHYYWLDSDTYTKRKQALKALIKADVNDVSSSVADIIRLEKLYLEILSKIYEMNIVPIDYAEYDNDIEKYIGLYGVNGDVHTERIKAAYEVYKCLRNGRAGEALSCIDKAVKYISSVSCLYAGEAVFCMKQLNLLKAFCS